MRTLKCTNCNASLSIQDDNRDFAFCEYCGTKIMLDDYRSTHRIVDEAKIKQIEAEKEVKMKELELNEKRRIDKQKKIKIKIIVTACLVGIAMICLLINIEFSGIVIPIIIMIILGMFVLCNGD